MGQNETKQKQEEVSDDYTVIKNMSPGQFWVRSKKKGEELLLRILTFYLEDEMQDYIKILEKRKKIKNPHLLELVEHTRISEQNMCSSTFKIRTVIEYPFKNLKDEIWERSTAVKRKYFQEDQLWSILYSCCHALYSLYINKFYHQCLNTEQIFIDVAGLVKIADSVLVATTKNYLSLMNEGSSETDLRYISPQLVNLVEDNIFYFYEKQKSDVFILAMIMLEIGNLTPVDYYNKDTKKFNFDSYISAITELRSRYTEQFCEILERMVVMDFKERPRLEEIINNIEQKTIYTGSSGNTSFESNQFNDRKTRQSKKFVSPVYDLALNSKEDYSWSQFNSNKQPVYQQIALKQQKINFKKAQIFVPSPYSRPPVTIQENKPPRSELFSQPYQSLPHNFSFLPQNSEVKSLPYSQKKQFKLESWNFQQVLKDIEKKCQQSYTPYQELVGLTTDKKTNVATNVQIVTKQASQPAQKPNISMKSSLGPSLANISPNHSIQINQQPPKFDMPPPPLIKFNFNQMGPRRFSETKFGGIELLNPTSNIKTQSFPVQNKTDFRVQSPIQQKQSSKITESIQKFSDSEKSTLSNFIIEESQEGKYEGFVNNGKKNGIGRLVYKNGDYYEGTWKDDHMDGYGKLFNSQGLVIYEGHWKNSEYNGQGHLYNNKADFSDVDKQIEHTDLDSIQEKWISYQGNFLNNQKHGKGVLNFVNQQKFQGVFFKNKAEGEGTFTTKEGDKVKGIWYSNKFISIA